MPLPYITHITTCQPSAPPGHYIACGRPLESLEPCSLFVLVWTLSVFGRPFVKRFALCYQTVVCLPMCLSVLSVCDIGELWPNGWMDQDETWRADRPQPSPHCVRWKPSSPFPKRRRSPQFLAHGSCGQTAAIAACIKMELGMEVSLGPVRIALDGDTAHLPQKGGRAPQFSAHICCGLTAGWIHLMPLGR